MINYIKKYTLKLTLIIFVLSLYLYSSNNNLLIFNKLILNNNKLIKNDLFFNYIGYNQDSSKFYSKNQINKFLDRIKGLNNSGIINNIKISYAIPNKINLFIEERIPKYIIKSNVEDIFFDNKGKIYSNILGLDYKVPIINLNFYDKNIVHDPFYNGIKLNSLISSIKKNKYHEKYLLNTFKILDWLSNTNFYTKIESVSINESTINISFNSLNILFNKDVSLIEEKINSLDKFISNKEIYKSLKIKNIYELEEINLCFDNQIIIKNKYEN